MTTFNSEAQLRSVTTGDGTVRVNLEIGRGASMPNRIDEVFTDAELEVTLTLIPKDAEDGKETLDNFEPLAFSGVARTNSFSTSAKHFALGLSFKKTKQSESELPHFAHCKAKIEATRTGTASDQAGEAGVGGESLYDEDTNKGDGYEDSDNIGGTDPNDDEFGNDEGDVNVTPTTQIEGT